jgi:hypothetical protein
MRARVLMAAVLIAVSSGCSSSGSSSSATAAPRAPSRQQDVITAAEIAERAADASNALQVVQKLRPQMLTTRGRFSPADSSDAGARPRVVVDGVAIGQVENLVNVNAISVMEIRYISATDATTRFGTGYVGGAILVTTKK